MTNKKDGQQQPQVPAGWQTKGQRTATTKGDGRRWLRRRGVGGRCIGASWGL